MHNSSPDGTHFLMEFFGCDKQQLNSIPFWKKLLSDATANAKIRVLNKHFYRFTPHGITGYLLLSASHISIHTWPEYEYAACDVFSCGGEDESTEIVRHIKIGRITAWVLKKSNPIVFLFLSIKYDPFITTAYLRHGANQFNGMKRRDWKIFIGSLLVSNAYWTLACYMGITLFEWGWKRITGL